MEFKIGPRSFAYPISRIKEIMEFPQVEPITGAPSSVIGAMNLRGQIVPVFELSIWLGVEALELTPKTCVVVTELTHNGNRYIIGNKVDLVTQVIDINDSQVEPMPDLAGTLTNPILMGLAKLDERLLTIIDVDKLLHSTQWEWLKENETPPLRSANVLGDLS
nr:chemotaxis protein CheW [Vibrio amylolyticus]